MRAPVEAERVGPYPALLFLMLSSATLFDGFDAAMLSFAASDTRATLGIGRDEWGLRERRHPHGSDGVVLLPAAGRPAGPPRDDARDPSRYAPETRGMAREEIAERLGAQRTRA